jgi:hypothetical protein
MCGETMCGGIFSCPGCRTGVDGVAIDVNVVVRLLRYEAVMSVNVPMVAGLGVFFAHDGRGFFG